MATKNESRSIQEIIWGRKKTKIESACETSTGTCLKKAKKQNIRNNTKKYVWQRSWKNAEKINPTMRWRKRWVKSVEVNIVLWIIYYIFMINLSRMR